MTAAVSKYTSVKGKNDGKNVTAVLYAQAALVPHDIKVSIFPILFRMASYVPL